MGQQDTQGADVNNEVNLLLLSVTAQGVPGNITSFIIIYNNIAMIEHSHLYNHRLPSSSLFCNKGRALNQKRETMIETND